MARLMAFNRWQEGARVKGQSFQGVRHTLQLKSLLGYPQCSLGLQLLIQKMEYSPTLECKLLEGRSLSSSPLYWEGLGQHLVLGTPQLPC